MLLFALLPVASLVSATGRHPLVPFTGYRQVPLVPCSAGIYVCVNQVKVGHPLPGQEQHVVNSIFDTGSASFWIPAGKADWKFHIDSVQGGEKNIVDEHGFEQSYDSGIGHSGYLASLPVTFGQSEPALTIDHTIVGGATDPMSSHTGGLMGVGTLTDSPNKKYDQQPPPVLQALVDNKVTATRAFSLFLDPNTWNNTNTGMGRVIFGGVDSSLFTGPLIQVPYFNKKGYQYNYWYWVNVLETKMPDGSAYVWSTGSSSLLDSGTPGLHLPPELSDMIAIEQLGGKLAPSQGFDRGNYTCDWDHIQALSKAGKTIDWKFNAGGKMDITIKTDPRTYALTIGGQCRIIILRGSQPGYLQGSLLGAAFLRNAYVVYDHTYHRIAMAQANKMVTKRTRPNIRVIGGTTANLPFVSFALKCYDKP